MFTKRKISTQIDPQQKELYEQARKRVLQKKGLFRHFIVFLAAACFFAIINLIFGIGEEVTIFGFNWYLIAILLWSFVLLIHMGNVFLFHSFMGREWTNNQMERLVLKQKQEIELIKKDIELMYPKEDLLQKKEEFIKNKQVPAAQLPSGNKQVITMIAAAGEKNAIGKDNQLVWHLPDDFKRFKTLTTNHHIIMGRKTFESFPKLLSNRIHIVITRNSSYQAEGGFVVSSLEQALEVAKNDQNPFIIGGGEIYKQGLKYANKIELTRVHGTFEADTFFPEIDTNQWELINEEFHDKDERHSIPFTYLTYIKR